MAIHKIIKDHLEEHNFDGLFNKEGMCACLTEHIGPSWCVEADCQPGYLTKASDSYSVTKDGAQLIGPEKDEDDLLTLIASTYFKALDSIGIMATQEHVSAIAAEICSVVEQHYETAKATHDADGLS